MSLTLEKGGEMDVLVGIHIYIHMQETLALVSCGVGEQTVCLCPCSVRACVRALHPQPPSTAPAVTAAVSGGSGSL